MKGKQAFIVFACAFVAAVSYGGSQSFHRGLLKEKFDTARWREFYSDDIWHIRCIFVDMDGDGVDEVITASTADEEDRIGYVWRIWRQSVGGMFKELKFTGDIFFLCHSESFYKMSQQNGPPMVVGLNMAANIENRQSDGTRSRVKSVPDCSFVVMESRKFALCEIQPNVDAWFRQKSVVSIERLYPEWYFGFDFRPPPPDPHSPYTTWFGHQQPKGDLRPGGGVIKPNSFDALAAEYRKSVKGRKGVAGKVDVFAVFLDADNDGDADCYVSSSAEGLDGDRYAWTLYMNRSGAILKATDAVYPVKDKKDLCALAPTVKAEKSGFCRVIRFDADPHFVILDGNGAPTKVRNAITNVMAHRIEKLECVCFPDEEVPKKQ